MTRAHAVRFALIGLLAGCSGGAPTSNDALATHAQRLRAVALIQPQFRPSLAGPFHGMHAPHDLKTRGIYASEFYGTAILGYPPNNFGNGPPACSITEGYISYVNDIMVDGRGHLVSTVEEIARFIFSAKTCAGPN